MSNRMLRAEDVHILGTATQHNTEDLKYVCLTFQEAMKAVQSDRSSFS